MCTALGFRCEDHYFGRNLDLEYSYNESVVITPRNFPFRFRRAGSIEHHFALIGIGIVNQGYPLYFDATNEHGLSMAGLNFPGNAVYREYVDDVDNITPFELIPWILSQCTSVDEAIVKCEHMNLLNESFSDALPLSPLHWMLYDKEKSIVLEPTKDGLQIRTNPLDVLTNNPPFEYHLLNLQNYMHVTNKQPHNNIAPNLSMVPYSRGMGAIGLPGDLSSASRFIRAVFTKNHAEKPSNEEACVGQFFHILDSVSQTEGCCITPHGKERTIYSSCCNIHKLIYYYCTYYNRQISAVKLLPEFMIENSLICYPLACRQNINYIDQKTNSTL